MSRIGSGSITIYDVFDAVTGSFVHNSGTVANRDQAGVWMPAVSSDQTSDFTFRQGGTVVASGTLLWEVSNTAGDIFIISTLQNVVGSVTLTRPTAAVKVAPVTITHTPSGATVEATFTSVIDGEQGTRGAGRFYADGIVWNNTVANNATLGDNIIGDRVIISDEASEFIETRFWNGASWVFVAEVIDGALLVNGPAVADKVFANEIDLTKRLTVGQGGTTIELNALPEYEYPLKVSKDNKTIFAVNDTSGILDGNILNSSSVYASSLHPTTIEFIRQSIGSPIPETGGVRGGEVSFTASLTSNLSLLKIKHGAETPLINLSINYNTVTTSLSPPANTVSLRYTINRDLLQVGTSAVASTTLIAQQTLQAITYRPTGSSQTFVQLYADLNVIDANAASLINARDYVYRITIDNVGSVLTPSGVAQFSVIEAAAGGATNSAPANNATITINTSNGITGGFNFTTDQSANETATLSLTYGTAANTVCVGNDSRLSNARDWTAAIVSETEARDGVLSDTRKWTSLRVRQNVENWSNTGTASNALNLGGILASSYMTLGGTQTVTGNKTFSGTASFSQTITGNISGSAGSATTATNANNVYITPTSSNSNFRMVFRSQSDTAGNSPLYQASASNFYYNPSSNTLTVPNLSGNASSASRLVNSRTISLSGGATGSIGFDGQNNVTIPVVVANDSHTHDGRYFTESESDVRYAKRTAEIVTLSKDVYSNAFNITSTGLGSVIRMSAVGTTGAAVIAVIADIIVNHSQDIIVTTIGSNYSPLTIRITSSGNEQFSVELMYNTGSGTILPLAVEVFPLNGEVVTFSSVKANTGTELVHVAIPGQSTSASTGAPQGSNIATTGSFSGIGTNLTALNASNLTSGTLPSDRIPATINGDKDFSGNVTVNRLLADVPLTVSDWNAEWRNGFFEASNGLNAPTATGWYWGLKAGHTSNSQAGAKYGLNLVIHNNDGFTPYIRRTDGNGAGVWQKIWTDYNDGVGSGLNADLLDGLEGNQYGRLTSAQTWTGANTFTTTITGSITGNAVTVTTNEHSTNNVDYPIIWKGNTASLYYTASKLTFNPATGHLKVSGDIWGEEVTETSALKYKNIDFRESLETSLQKVVAIGRLGTAVGTLKNDEMGKVQRWFIADEVQPIMPEVVNLKEGEVEGLHYTRMLPDAYAAIAKQQEIIDVLMARVESLERRLDGDV